MIWTSESHIYMMFFCLNTKVILNYFNRAYAYIISQFSTLFVMNMSVCLEDTLLYWLKILSNSQST